MHASNQTLFFVTTLQGWVYKTRVMHASNQTRFFVTILQGWAYKTQHMRDACEQSDAFLCNNIARMGLQNTKNTRDALMIVFDL